MTEPDSRVPEPGREAGRDATAEGVDADVDVNEEDGTVTRREESGVGPGAGEGDVVKVTAPLQREGDEVTGHPNLRDDRKADVERR